MMRAMCRSAIWWPWVCCAHVCLVANQCSWRSPFSGTSGQSGRSGAGISAGDQRTVPPAGIFLGVTLRIASGFVEFISFGGDLRGPICTRSRALKFTLHLGAGADAALKASEFSFVAVSHQDCRRSPRRRVSSDRIHFIASAAALDRQRLPLARPMGVRIFVSRPLTTCRSNLLSRSCLQAARVGKRG